MASQTRLPTEAPPTEQAPAPPAPVANAVPAALTPQRVLALQRSAGNRAVADLLQRDFLGDAIEAGSAAARALEAAALTLTDPNRAIGMLAQIGWDDVPDAVKARVVDALLDAAAVLIRNGAAPVMELSPMWQLVKSGALGFLSQVRSNYSADQKIAVANRLIGLWSSPTGAFNTGFGIGLALGLWDGVSGPFVLMWDLLKLEGTIVDLQIRALATLADDDQRRELIAAAQAAYERAVPLVARAMVELASGSTDAAALLRMIGSLADAATEAAQGAGAQMADALMHHLLSAPDRELGENLGRIEGNLLFEALLLVLTDGGYTALKEAVSGARWVAEAMERINELRASLRAGEAAELLANSLARFTAFVRQSRVLAPIAEALAEVWTLIVRFIRMSYGLEGGAERAGARVVGVEAETLEEGVRIARQLPGGGRLKLLETGRIVVCHSPCMYIEQRFARELEGAGGEAFRARLENVRTAERNAVAAGDRVAEENAFALADALNGELENVRLGGLRAVSGLDDTVLRELLLEANDNGPRVERLLRDAGNDPERVRPLLRYCARDEATLERMMEGAEHFRPPPSPPGAIAADTRLAQFHPNSEANVPHFLDEHTFAHFDVNQIGNSPNKTFWPPGTTRADIEGRLVQSLEQLQAEGRLGTRGGRWQRVVNLPGNVLVQVGSNPQRIGQFFPLGGPGILTYSNQELRALAILFGR